MEKIEEGSQDDGGFWTTERVRPEIFSLVRGLLDSDLARLTDAQREFFNRLYPNGPTLEKLPWAICQVRNTIRKNSAMLKQSAQTEKGK